MKVEIGDVVTNMLYNTFAGAVMVIVVYFTAEQPYEWFRSFAAGGGIFWLLSAGDLFRWCFLKEKIDEGMADQ